MPGVLTKSVVAPPTLAEQKLMEMKRAGLPVRMPKKRRVFVHDGVFRCTTEAGTVFMRIDEAAHEAAVGPGVRYCPERGYPTEPLGSNGTYDADATGSG